MDEHDAQRFIDEQRYQAELPFPVSAVFTHYAHSSSKNYALRSLQLVATAQSTIRYAAIVAACDYATSHDADETVLNQLRLEWLGGKKPSFGTWYGALMKLLSESGKSWRNQFVTEFAKVDSELLEKKIQPLIHGRNVEIGHAEYYEALAMKHFVELQEENLFAIMEQFSFLARYPLAFVEVEDDYETPSPGTKQAVNICRGASHNFARYTVTPSHPLPPGIPFIWNDEYTGILTLSPFIIYGRATTDAEQKEKVKGVAHIQGLMVLNGVPKGAPVYTSVDAEAQFSLDSFEFPPKEQIQNQVESALKKGLDIPLRMETRLSEDEKELFVRTTDFVAPTSEEDRGKPSRRKPRLKKVLVSAILGILVLIAGFASYSHNKTTKVSLPIVKGAKSIAVVPFKNISDDPKLVYLCEGLAEVISNKLSLIQGITVKDPASVFTLKDKDVSNAYFGKVLNINNILKGSVQKKGDHFVIIAQFEKVDGSIMWSHVFDCKSGEFIDIQNEISITIAEKLKGNLKEEERQALESNYTKNPEAFDLYLQGLKYYDVSNVFKSIECLDKAIKKDSKFAPAYIKLSKIYHELSIFNHSEEDLKKAKIYCDNALKIDDNYADAHAWKGYILYQSDWNFTAAESEFKRSSTLHPGSASAYAGYSNLLKIMDRKDECLSELYRAVDLDPLSGIQNEIIDILSCQGKYVEAEEVYKKAKELLPNTPSLDWAMGRSYCQQGEYKEAIEKYQPLIPKWSHHIECMIGYTYGKSGEKDKARQILDKLIKKEKKEYVSPVYIALIYNGLGENDNVFTWLNKGYEKHDFILLYIKVWPEFQNLRSDQRYHDMLKKIKLE
jgi:adenylate cyclase